MRSMRMAALAVVMTLMFSGLALARDHDHDNDKHDHWDKHTDRDRHHDGDRDRNRNNDRWRNNDQNHERDRGRWERDQRQNNGYYGGQFTTAILAAIRAEMVIRAVAMVIRAAAMAIPAAAMAIPAAATATPAAVMAVPEAAEMRVTASAIRTAATWRAAIWRRTSRSIPIPATSTETGPMATTAHTATRTITGLSTAVAMRLGINRAIAEAGAGDSDHHSSTT